MQDHFLQNQSAYPTKVRELAILFYLLIAPIIFVFMHRLGRGYPGLNQWQSRGNLRSGQLQLRIVWVALASMNLGIFAYAQVRLPLTSDSMFGAQEWVRPSEPSLGSGALIRPSLATAQSASERAHLFGLSQPATSLDYNIKLGPISFKLGAGLGTEFNDNINLSDNNREADFILSPQFSI